jgi:hypothetical protein
MMKIVAFITLFPTSRSRRTASWSRTRCATSRAARSAASPRRCPDSRRRWRAGSGLRRLSRVRKNGTPDRVARATGSTCCGSGNARNDSCGARRRPGPRPVVRVFPGHALPPRLRQPDEVVGGGGQAEGPVNPGDAAMTRLAQLGADLTQPNTSSIRLRTRWLTAASANSKGSRRSASTMAASATMTSELR